MTQELVTVVRYRTVIEEVVLSRADFDRANVIENPDDFEQFLEAQKRIDAFPYQDWGWGVDEDFVGHEVFGYMAFAGDVSGETDDLVLCSYWQHDLPITVDEMETPTIEQLAGQPA